MPKATLHFQLPEEVNEFKLACRGTDYFSALWDISQIVRNINNDEIDCHCGVKDISNILDDVILEDID